LPGAIYGEKEAELKAGFLQLKSRAIEERINSGIVSFLKRWDGRTFRFPEDRYFLLNWKEWPFGQV